MIHRIEYSNYEMNICLQLYNFYMSTYPSIHSILSKISFNALPINNDSFISF